MINPKNNVVSIRLNDKQLEKLRQYAEREETSMTDVIRDLLLEHLDKQLVSV